MLTQNFSILLQKYVSDTKGNFALYFALVFMTLMAGIGAAIDMGGAQRLETTYQDYADAAVLAASRTRPKEQGPMATVASAIVNELNNTGTTPTVITILSSDRKTLQVHIDGNHQNTVMSMFGKAKTAVGVMAETQIEVHEYAEIALVLDTTRSMNYFGRLTALKAAANNFIDIIESVDAEDRIRVSVVPFGQYVNVGLGNRTQPWLTVPDDWLETFPDHCFMQQGPFLGQTCVPGVTEPHNGYPAQDAVPATDAIPPTYGTCFDDGVPHQCVTNPGSPGHPGYPATPEVPPYAGGEPTTICTSNYGPPVEVCVPVPPVWHRWSGSVGSRRNSFNVDESYSTGEPRVPGFLDLPSGSPILPMTTNMNAVRNKINSLTVHGETYSPAGLIWGHRMVDPSQPFPLNRTIPNNEIPRRVVIFMTDGFNTKSRTNELHEGADRAEADRVSQIICDNMRQDPTIEVYSVSFQVSDNQARRLVEDCATEPDMYYQASNGARLHDAFEDIAFSLLTPRLTQ